MQRFNVLCSVTAMASVLLNVGASGFSQTQETTAGTGKTVTVAADGSGDFKTVQEAINAAPTDKTKHFVIHIKPGTYKEKLTVPKGRGPITFLGDEARTTVLTYDDYAGRLDAAGKELGTGGSYSVKIDSDDFIAENITFENSHPMGGGKGNQALALSFSGDRAVFRKCRFLGRQDTIYVERKRQYFEDCYITGQVDYIFGGATAWFERCELHCVAPGVSITAASTPQEQPYGYVFSSCKITAEPPADWKTHLGRPWRPYASVTYLNTEMADIIAPEGWDNWPNATNNEGKDNEKTARFAEYDSKTPDGKLIVLTPRAVWTRRLTAEEAAAITIEKVFGDWDPRTALASDSATNAAVTTRTAAAVAPQAADPTLTMERIATLPADRRATWQQYLERSAAHLRSDKEVLNAELKANGLAEPVAAPEGSVFKVSTYPETWFASDEARRIADAVVSFQTPSGGWSKAVAFDKGPRRPGMHWTTHSDSWYYVGTFDNRATTEQMILLAKIYQATKDQKYATAFLKGLDYIFDAQFPNGGWPQVYPLAGDYHDEVTFNDDMMVHVLELLRDVSNGTPEYSFVDEARRAKARDAVAAGVQCILQAQVVQNGKLTVWGAQHDALTLAPAAARKFEPVSLTAGESLGIVRFLMDMKKPSPEVIRAVQGAVAWYDASKIMGIEVVKKPDTTMSRGFDTVVVPNPTAPPIWARFYELGTNRPIFIGRDAVVRYSLAEIDPERRTGYAWYQPKPKDLLEKDYPKWQAKWAPEQNVLKH